MGGAGLADRNAPIDGSLAKLRDRMLLHVLRNHFFSLCTTIIFALSAREYRDTPIKLGQYPCNLQFSNVLSLKEKSSINLTFFTIR